MKKKKKQENDNLNFILKYEWFDKIAKGEKTKEYREITDYNTNKLFLRNYKTVTFLRGYNKQNKLKFKINGIRKTTDANDLNLPEVYEISLGERIYDKWGHDLSFSTTKKEFCR